MIPDYHYIFAGKGSQSIVREYILSVDNSMISYGTIMYVNFIFVAIFAVYVTEVAPVVSCCYRAGNTKELTGLLKKSISLILGLNGIWYSIVQAENPLGKILDRFVRREIKISNQQEI